MTQSTEQPQNMRTFLIIWFGQMISIMGSGLTGFGLSVRIFDRTGEATPFALNVLFYKIPRTLLGPLADYVFEPMLWEGGVLRDTAIATLVGTGPGRGIGLIFILSACFLMLTSLVVYTYPRVRNLEVEIPDAVNEAVPS
jgi:hypothetical protein